MGLGEALPLGEVPPPQLSRGIPSNLRKKRQAAVEALSFPLPLVSFCYKKPPINRVKQGPLIGVDLGTGRRIPTLELVQYWLF